MRRLQFEAAGVAVNRAKFGAVLRGTPVGRLFGSNVRPTFEALLLIFVSICAVACLFLWVESALARARGVVVGCSGRVACSNRLLTRRVPRLPRGRRRYGAISFIVYSSGGGDDSRG